VPFTDAVGALKAGPVPVAVVMTSFEPGGTERQMIELVRRLDRGRWAVHLGCFRARGAWFDRAAEAALSVAEFRVDSFRSSAVWRHASRFAAWCRDRGIAIVHASELYSNIFALPAAALARVPVRIGNRREINPDKTAAQIALQRAAYTFAHRVVANSRAAASRLERERIARRKIAVIPNGIDCSRFATHQEKTSRRRVIVVANLRREKAHDVLLRAAVTIVRRFPDATFDVVGDGPQREPLAALTHTLGLERAVRFLGHRDDIPALLAAADIFVLPSRSEAFPNAVLEAMAAGLPVVATAVGGIVELVADTRTGLLVRPDDPASLAARLCDVMLDAPFASRLGEAARAEAHARYSFDRMVDSFDRLYVHELTARGVLSAAQPQLAAS
jgi:L-malate glycosyltransferase